MRTILLTGAGGLIGSAAQQRFQEQGRSVAIARRTHAGWELPSAEELGEFDLVHLAGRPLATRWTKKTKAEIRHSRVEMTKRLLDSLPYAPRTIVAASAMGFYGCRGDEILTETSLVGADFLPHICEEWENAVTSSARVVNLRFGLVLSPNGGALKKMLPIFRLGVGGKMGSGDQWWSWISVTDAITVIEHCLNNEKLVGPINAVSPNPVRNSEFTKLLAKCLHRPAFFAVPRFALRIMLGEMADATLLCSQRVSPQRLIESGFDFQFPTLTKALENLV